MGRKAQLTWRRELPSLPRRSVTPETRTSQPQARTAPRAASAELADDLPFVIALWRLDGCGVERILGRAASAALAQAILTAAQTEQPSRRITLTHGEERLGESL